MVLKKMLLKFQMSVSLDLFIKPSPSLDFVLIPKDNTGSQKKVLVLKPHKFSYQPFDTPRFGTRNL